MARTHRFACAVATAGVLTLASATSWGARAGTTVLAWTVEPAANVSGDNHDDTLNAVSCPAPSDCWAAGDYYVGTSLAGNPYQTLIEHDTGSGWGIVTSPNINTGTTQFNQLYGISCASTTACWAVGSYYAGGIYNSLAEQFDGTSWQLVTAPSPPGSAFTQLLGVSCVAASDCWAVGSSTIGITFQTMTEHWDGSSWTLVASPNAGTAESNTLYAVSCAASNDCTAVGDAVATGNVEGTLVEHWDGTAWAIVPSANIAQSATQYLKGIDCRTACVAVGSYYNGAQYQTLTEVRTASGWEVDASPSAAKQSSYLLSVSCSSVSDCWAVGYDSAATGGALTDHYANGAWSAVTNPSVANSQLIGVQCLAADTCSAVGLNGRVAFAENYGASGSPPPTGPSATDESAGGDAANGFATPVALPGSHGLGEPSLIHDSHDRLFAAAPQGLGNVNTAGGSPLYTSLDKGATWSQPLRAQGCTALSGADSDLVTDSADTIYATDLYIGDSCLAVSTDHGQTFASSNPVGSEVQPGDDRPWLAYDARSNQVLSTYDGADAIRVANTAPLVTPAASDQMVQDVAAVPESALSAYYTPSTFRACVCPPGGIAVDNSTGAHAGRVYVSFSDQFGTAIAYTDVTGQCPNCTVSPTWSSPIVIPGSGSSGAPFENEWNFDPIKVDSNGTVYVMWAHATGYDTTNNVATGDVVEQYSYSADGGNTWSTPVQLSGAGTTTFPTMDVVAPGVLDVAWLGTEQHGDPNLVPSTTVWNLDYARVTAAASATPSVTAAVATAGMHQGCIQTGGGKACTDRSLLDFFQLTDTSDGVPNILYTAGDSTVGTSLFFTRLTGQPGSVVAESPAPVALLLVPLVVAIAGPRTCRRLFSRGLAGPRPRLSPPGGSGR